MVLVFSNLHFYRKVRDAGCFPSLKMGTMFILYDSAVTQSAISVVEKNFIGHEVLGCDTQSVTKYSTVDHTC